MQPAEGVQEAEMRDLERHGIGLAHVAADGSVIDRIGAASSWLPSPGVSCFGAPLLTGLYSEFRDLREGRGDLIALPNVGMGERAEKATITIAWDQNDARFSIASARSFGASETELMLVRERRERRLADEQAEAARRRANISEALYRDIVESGADLVLRLNADRRIAFANSKLVAMCGGDLAALVGRNIAEALPAHDGAPWTTIVGEASEVSFEQQIVNAHGAPIWIWWRAAWLGAAGGPAEYQAVGRDITLLRKLRADVERANAEARSALVMRERLKIAHDLHDTIVHALVAVVAQLRLVRKLATRAPDQLDAELARAEEAARAGLDRSREALGQVRFQRAGVEGLSTALARAAARFEERTGLAIDVRLDPALDHVIGDRAEILYRIIEEALRNVEAHANAQSVRLSASEIDGQVEIVVADDGRGFDPTLEHPGHYGLQGMDEQADMLGGRLTIVSEPGRGATTTIRAPIRARG